MPLPAGLRLGPYELVSFLGAGAMGEVHRARDTRLDRIVAIKVLRANVASDSDARERFEREARTIAALNHPHICMLHDVGRQDDVSFLVMEFLEGQTLDLAIRQRPLLPDRVLVYARQIGEGLVAAHAKGVVHRDLKPANLFLTSEDRVKILDFGIAKVLAPAPAESETIASNTQYGQFVGTVGYAAPEQLRGQVVDARTDLFALGAVLHQLLTGRRLFARHTEAETIGAILHDEPPALPSTVPAALAATVMRCLAKHPAARFQSAQEFLHALDATDSSVAAISSSGAPSLAVLPFADLSPNRDQEYFCDGMADELIGTLMSVAGLRVASRTSAFQFRGGAHDVTDIGRRLRVGHVLEGSVRRAGERMRVSVQLIDVRDGFQLWSERYDRALDDVFAVQDDIAKAIVDKLRTQFAGALGAPLAPRGPANVDAHTAFLKGKHSIYKLTAEGIHSGIEHLKRALELEPEYADAHAALAHAFILQGLMLEAPRAAMPRAREAALRAMAIDPNCAECHLSLAMVLHWYDWDFAEAERAYRRAIELSPGNEPARRLFSSLLAFRGRGDEGIVEAKRAMELDPLSLGAHRALVDALYFLERYDEAIAHAEQIVAFEPAFFSAYWMLGLAKAQKGLHQEALDVFMRGRPFAYGDATLEGYIGWTHALLGHTDEARAIAKQLEARRETGYLAAPNIALIYQGLGDLDEAFAWYGLGLEERAPHCMSLQWSPHLAPIRNDPRFQALIAHVESGAKEGA